MPQAETISSPVFQELQSMLKRKTEAEDEVKVARKELAFLLAGKFKEKQEAASKILKEVSAALEITEKHKGANSTLLEVYEQNLKDANTNLA